MRDSSASVERQIQQICQHESRLLTVVSMSPLVSSPTGILDLDQTGPDGPSGSARLGLVVADVLTILPGWRERSRCQSDPAKPAQKRTHEIVTVSGNVAADGQEDVEEEIESVK